MYTKVSDNLRLKHFRKDDYAALFELEKHSSEYFWDQDDFEQILSKQVNGGCYLIVKEQPVGFVVYESNQDHFHILNLVVHEKHRREGCGTALLNRMKEKMRGKFKFLKLDVRDTNLDSHLFLRKNGFVAELVRGHFQDHYPNEPVKYQDGYFFTYQKDLENEEFNFGANGCPIRINNMGE